VKALDGIGPGRAARFLFFTLAMTPYRLALFPPVRSVWLRMLGAAIGRRTILHDDCFVGDECLLDLADEIRLEDHVTLAERVLILTHTNVGYRDHPLQPHFPAMAAPVSIRRGSFVGAAVTILPGVTIGPESFVAAGSVVTADVPPRTLVAGIPARALRTLE
jgi:acetyltransferase-like isoleucine patch superfamily enzyme